MEMHEDKQLSIHVNNLFFTSLISGGLAGVFVDIALFPIDTLKTRLQSEHGFIHSGGFTKLYKGLMPIILGSAPTAALFFVTYESIKMCLIQRVPIEYSPLVHMGSASVAESISCFIRVPVEVLKQRRQVILPDEGRFNIKLLYRGYWSTALRDVPFSLIQFSLWEYFKKNWAEYAQRNVFPIEGAICGAFAGSIAATITTPLDVVKTRIMLFNRNSYDSSQLSILNILLSIQRSKGVQGLFAGLIPRIVWISVGGFIFFGVYDKSKILLSS